PRTRGGWRRPRRPTPPPPRPVLPPPPNPPSTGATTVPPPHPPPPTNPPIGRPPPIHLRTIAEVEFSHGLGHDRTHASQQTGACSIDSPTTNVLSHRGARCDPRIGNRTSDLAMQFSRNLGGGSDSH